MCHAELVEVNTGIYFASANIAYEFDIYKPICAYNYLLLYFKFSYKLRLMKNILIYSFFIANFFICSAQVSLEYGDVFKNEKRQIPVDIIGKDENGYYLLYSEGKFGQGDDMFLRKFNLDLTPSDKEINLKDKDYEDRFRSLGLNKVKDNIVHVFYLMTDTGKKYYYQFVDLDTFTLKESKFITEILNDSKKATNSISKFMISDDDETITLFYTIPNKNKDIAKVKVQTFDSNFNEKAISVYEFPYRNDVLTFRNIFTNENDELFILCKKYDSYKNLIDENNHRYEHLLFKISNNKLKLITTIQPNEVHLRYLKCNLTNKNEVILTGLFSKNNMYAMAGIYSTKVNLETGNVIYEKYNKLSVDFFAKLMDEGKKKEKAKKKFNEGKRENPYFILKNTIELENQELLILAEQIWSYTYNYVTTFYHHDIAAIKLNNSGDVIWSTKIGKKNDKNNVSIYNSYFPVLNDNKLLLFYNGNEKNLNHRTGILANSFGSFTSAFVCTTLNTLDASYERKILSSKEKLQGITIRPGLYNWIDDNTLLMFGQDIDNLKNQRFIKIKL